MRLIDVDALMDDIRKHAESYFAEDFAHIWVDEQPTVDAIPFKWTPCSEQLPEETGTYLVTINYHGNTYVSMDNFSPSGWELTGWTGLATRLAWAKVPEPYKGETE